jgi:autotransporter translocation and assembly factor TamB
VKRILPSRNIKRTQRDGKTHLPHFPVKWAVCVLSVLIMIPFALILALHVPSVQKEIITRAENQIESATNYKIELESFTWWPFTSLRLANVKVQAQGMQILTCEDVRVSYRLLTSPPFISLEELYLKKPLIHLERSPDGKWLIPSAKPKGGQGGGTSGQNPFWQQIHLPDVRIDAGRIDASQGGANVLSIKDITGIVHLKTVQGPNGPSIRLDLDNWHAQADLSSWGRWKLACSATIQDNQLVIQNAALSSPDDALIELNGRWDTGNFENGKASLKLSQFFPGTIPALPPRLSPLGPVSGGVSVLCENGKLSIEHNIQTGVGSITGNLNGSKIADGSYDIKLGSGFSNVKLPDMPSVPEMNLNGHIDVSGQIGDGRVLAAQFTTTLDSSKIAGESLQKCELAGDYLNNILSIKSNAIKSSVADFKFSASADMGGLWDPKHAGGIKADISVEKANLEKLSSKIQQRVGGTVSFEAHHEPGNFQKFALWHAKADANLNIPEAITLKGSAVYQSEQLKIDYDLDCREVQKVTALYPQWQGKGRVLSRGSLNGKWPDLVWDGEITWPHFQYQSVQADQVALKGKGKFTGKDERRELSLKAQNVLFDSKKIGALNIDLEQQKDACSFQLKGDGIINQISARLSGRVEKIWDFPLVVVSTQGQVGFKDQAGSLECKFEMEKDGIRIHSASMLQGKQKLTVSGGIVSDTKTDLRVALEAINAGQIMTSLGLKDVFNGVVSGQVQVSGKSDQPELKMNMQAANCLIQGKQRIEQMQFQGTYTKDILQLQGEMKAAAVQAPLAFTARVPMRLSFKPLQFEVKQTEELSSDIKIAGLEAESILPFLPFLNKLGGQIQGEVHAGGSIKQPVVSGAGTWKSGSFQEKRWPHLAEKIQAEWQADSKNIYVKRAEISHLGGNVIVTGFIEYPQFETMGFKADGTDLQVHDIYGIDGKVSGQAEIKHTTLTAELTGTLRFSKAQMNLGQLETDIARNIQIIDTDSKGGDLLEIKEIKNPGQFSNKLKMDVVLELPPTGTMVTGKGLKAEITGGLKLEKVPGGPIRLGGELQALRGTYSFQGKELKIVDGTLIFTGTPEPDPQLRIVCQKQVKDIILQALVSGPLSHPKLALSSVPAMNQVDILSYFMFDHPAGDLSTNEKSQFQDRAAAWLGSQTSGMIKSVFGNSPLAPDAVGYRSTNGKNEHGFTNNPTPVTNSKDTGIVEVGKYITPDLFVKYGRSVTGEQGNEVQLEYRVNQHISVQTQVGGADQSGVDIFWRHDFGK